jgi:hypothetical protein
LNILGGAWCVSHLCACSHACVRWVYAHACVWGACMCVRTILESMAPLYVSCLVGEGGGRRVAIVARLRLVFVDGFASLRHRHPPPSPAGTTSASHPRSVGWMRTCPHDIACSSFRVQSTMCSGRDPSLRALDMCTPRNITIAVDSARKVVVCGLIDRYSRRPDGPPLIEESLGIRYVVSVYFIMTTMASVGYGDVTPKSTGGELLDCLWVNSL